MYLKRFIRNNKGRGLWLKNSILFQPDLSPEEGMKVKMVIEILKTIIFGIVEGITEWLPISSTGHLILVEQFIKLNVTDSFMEMFRVVIQLGAIMAVVVLYFRVF